MILDNENRWTMMIMAGIFQLSLVLLYVQIKEFRLLPIIYIIGFAFIFKIIEVLIRVIVYFITDKEI